MFASTSQPARTRLTQPSPSSHGKRPPPSAFLRSPSQTTLSQQSCPRRSQRRASASLGRRPSPRPSSSSWIGSASPSSASRSTPRASRACLSCPPNATRARTATMCARFRTACRAPRSGSGAARCPQPGRPRPAARAGHCSRRASCGGSARSGAAGSSRTARSTTRRRSSRTTPAAVPVSCAGLAASRTARLTSTFTRRMLRSCERRRLDSFVRVVCDAIGPLGALVGPTCACQCTKAQSISAGRPLPGRDLRAE